MKRQILVVAFVIANALVLYWASEIIIRYPSSRYVFIIVVCLIVLIPIGMKLPKSIRLVSLIVLGAVFGHVVTTVANLGLEAAYIPQTGENFFRMLSREPSTLVLGTLGFPALLGGWFQGVLAMVLIWILQNRAGNNQLR